MGWDTGVFWLAEKYLCAQFRSRGSCTDDFGRQGTANIFLGSRYRIDRIRMISGLTDPSRTVRTFRVHIGPLPARISFSLTPEPFSPWIVEVRDNREQILDVPIPEHEDVEFVQVTVGEHGDDWEVNEIEVYAKGFVEQSTYISNILDFEQPMAWVVTCAGQDDKTPKPKCSSNPDPDKTTTPTCSGASPDAATKKYPSAVPTTPS